MSAAFPVEARLFALGATTRTRRESTRLATQLFAATSCLATRSFVTSDAPRLGRLRSSGHLGVCWCRTHKRRSVGCPSCGHLDVGCCRPRSFLTASVARPLFELVFRARLWPTRHLLPATTLTRRIFALHADVSSINKGIVRRGLKRSLHCSHRIARRDAAVTEGESAIQAAPPILVSTTL